jgi:hypothetical protein
MAGSGKKTFTAGDVLTASDVNNYLMDQTVMVFGGTAARSSAIPTPSEGMVSYQTDTDAIEAYDGTNWVTRVATSLPFATQAGKVTVTGTATITWADATRFTQTPIILVSVANGNVNRTKVTSFTPTTTSFSVIVYSSGTTQATVSAEIAFLGIQMTSSSAAG